MNIESNDAKNHQRNKSINVLFDKDLDQPRIKQFSSTSIFFTKKNNKTIKNN